MKNDAQADLLQLDQQHLIHPLHSDKAHASGKVWTGGSGATLIDANGERFLDGLSGLWNNTAGNGRKELIEAATKQMETMAYASGYAGSSNPKFEKCSKPRSFDWAFSLAQQTALSARDGAAAVVP